MGGCACVSGVGHRLVKVVENICVVVCVRCVCVCVRVRERDRETERERERERERETWEAKVRNQSIS